MGRFRNLETGVVVSVDDSKDERFAVGFEPAAAGDEKPTSSKAPAKRSAAKKSE